MGGFFKRFLQRKTNTPDSLPEENQLTLSLKKEELFDPYTILPHPEVNQNVYDAVDRFVQRYSGSGMTVTIMSEPVNPSLQAVFRESYYKHYDDEFQKMQRYLHKRYMRVAGLLLISIVSFLSGSFLSDHLTRFGTIAGVVSEISIFCLWEIGYTHFDRSEASLQRKLILRARDAEIEFL